MKSEAPTHTKGSVSLVWSSYTY